MCATDSADVALCFPWPGHRGYHLAMCTGVDSVHLWRERPGVSGPYRLGPVSCQDYLRSLERALIEATGDDAAPQKVLSKVPFTDGMPAE